MKRMRARAMMAVASSWASSGYVGGRSDRRSLREWNPRAGSASTDQLPGLSTLRSRSRDMARNTPLAAGAINTNITNVVGSGLKLQARPDRKVLGLDDEAAEAWEGRAELIWQLWTQAEHADITGEQDFAELQDLALRSVLESGDVLVVRRFVESGLLGTRLQLIEADRLTNPRHAMDRPGLQGGVEVDEIGRPIAYHIQSPHPGDRFNASSAAEDWTRVPVRGSGSGERQAVLLYRKVRVGQQRGVPYLAPVIDSLKQLDRYSEAEIMAALVGSMFTVFVRTESGDGLAPHPDNEADETDRDYHLGSGSILDLLPGEDVEFANPNRPNQAFDAFVVSILRQVGTALELPLEVLTKHFQSSYSAARSALLEAWKTYTTRRDWLVRRFCQPTYAWVVTEAAARGLIDAPGFFDDPVIRAAWLKSSWIGPAKGQIDELKEVKAAKLKVDMGISTLQEECASITGGDWETKHRQREKERRLRSEAGLEASDIAGGLTEDGDDDDPDERDRREREQAA